MALSDFLSLTDDSLTTAFSAPAFNRERARAALSERLGKAISQFTATEPARGRKMFALNNGIVKLTLPVEIEGKSEFLIPSERFKDAVTKLKASVDKGELDKQLETYTKAASEGGVIGQPRAAGERRKRAPMSEEAKAAMAAKRKATMEKNGTKSGRQKAS